MVNKFGNIQNFLGCDSSYADSKIVVFGAGYDGTTSNKPGTRFAPSAMRQESYGLETYSPYLDKDIGDYNIYDAGDLELYGNPDRVLNMVENVSNSILSDSKIPIMIGGEHLLSFGMAKAISKKYPDFNIVHFDAHTDLRDSYMQERLSHATVIRRCYELLDSGKIYQFGIRSGTKEEFEWAKNNIEFNPFNLNNIEKILELKEKPVYLTIDLDILDSGIFPGTGTPEAGGVSFLELINSFKYISKLNIIAADIVELAPNYDISNASTAIACKILRELLLSIA